SRPAIEGLPSTPYIWPRRGPRGASSLAKRAPKCIDTLRGRNQNTRLVFPGGVPKRSTGTDCKSVGFGLRRFESFPHHHWLGRVLEPKATDGLRGEFEGFRRARGRHQRV